MARVRTALGSSCGSRAAGLRSGALQPLPGPHDLILPAGRPPNRSRQQEHHRCRFCSGIRMFILFSGSPRLLRQSGCQSAPRVLEFGLKPSLPGPIFCLSPALLAVRGEDKRSALAQGTELETCVLVFDFLKDTGTDSPFFRW